MKKLNPILVLLSFFVGIFLSAENLSDETQIQIEKILKKESSSFKKGGFSFAIADDVMPLFSKSFGWADHESKRPMTPETTQNIASVTKLFTATAIMKLYSEGRVDLDVPISAYIPGFHLEGSTEDDYTLRLLLTHYSGLPSNYLKGFYNSWDGTDDSQAYFPEFIADLQKETPLCSPGEFYIYSNLGYNIAAYIISKVTGLSYEEYVRSNILEPLNMNNSWYEYFKSSNKELATGYSEGEIVISLGERGTGDGGLNSTVVDLTSFGSMFIKANSELLSKGIITKMLSKQNNTPNYDFDYDQAIGWHISEISGYPGKYFYYHEGGTHPFSSMLVMLPEEKLTMAFLGNEDEFGFTKLSCKILKIIMKERTGEKPKILEQDKPETVELESKYFGTYATRFGILTIKKKMTGIVLNLLGFNLHLIEEHGGFYGVQQKLLGLIPIPIEDIEAFKFKFQDNGFKSVGIYRHGLYIGLGTYFEQQPIENSWNNRLGEYKIINPDNRNFFNTIRITIDNKSGEPMMFVTTPALSGEIGLVLDLTNNNYGKIRGKGNNLGTELKVIQQDGKELLKFSGYLLEKIQF